eukprot:CAMPEP_0174259634 /NCGR_PEP_ID=MMETSP0439-20130205/8438_1 /TAXON_ID=0 /ORGANISM="Stereomyxa ramosa, Strain Chinc5" /LENGTH=101 /DNA_ID=CAMNT_0015343603 /DNA_START=1055 /DNA_END=1360 /DNA_ORIENTATION=+
MWCEHFGIGVVEMMASGVITIAHNSGGPKQDIIHHNKTGFLATTAFEYATYMDKILEGQEQDEEFFQQMQEEARTSTQRFSESHFKKTFASLLSPIIQSCT